MDLERIAILLATSLVLVPVSNAVEWGFSLYGGWNGSPPSDVQFTGSGTDWTVQNVPWSGVSFQTPGPYYGARVDVRPASLPGWRIAIDYNHAKVRAVADAIVTAEGTINGAPGPTNGAVGDWFDVLEFTDGLNIITVNAIRDLSSLGRFHPYVGAGIGINIPHVEVTGNGGTVPFPTTFDYRFGGPAAQAFVGASVDLSPHLSVFAEAKISWAQINSPIAGDHRIHTTIITGHLTAGITLTFGRM